MIERIQHYGEQIVNSESLFLPTTAAQIATIIQETQTQQLFPLLLSKQELEQNPSIQALNKNNDLRIELALSLLHNIGTLVYQPTTQMICLQPQILIKMMASFICPNEHLSILFGEEVPTITLPRDAIFRYSDLAIRVKRILQLSSESNSNDKEEVDKMIGMMESLSFYYH